MSVQIEIKSRKGTFITVDKEVADKIGKWDWYLDKEGYAIAYLPGSGRKNRKMVRLARAVIWAETGEWPEKNQEVDHINHDVLDNRMENLRVGTKSLNQRNMLKHKGASSKFQGVSWNKRTQKWTAQAGVRIEGKVYHIGACQTSDEILAAKCADCIRDLIGGWIPRNYPERSFLDKWKEIGEKQRRQIRRRMWFNNISIHDNSIFIE
jgi:hypothetical protein